MHVYTTDNHPNCGKSNLLEQNNINSKAIWEEDEVSKEAEYQDIYDERPQPE